MIFYIILSDALSLPRAEFNFLAGSTLPMLGRVKVVALNVCPECLNAAVKIKLIRMSFLFFLVTISLFYSGNDRRVNIRWFVVVFIVLAVGFNLSGAFAHIMEYFKEASNLYLAAALAAIFFSVDFDSIIEQGIMPLGIIFFSWGLVILLIYLIRNLF